MSTNTPNMLRITALAALERVINVGLHYDPGTAHALASLHGHVFAIESTDPSFTLYLHVDVPITLTERYEGDVTTRIVGTLQDFVRLAVAEDPASALINSDISVHGKSGPLIELQKILKHLDIDWEEPIADVLGEVPAHQIGIGLRKTAKWAKTLPPMLQQRLEKHLFDEAKLLPRREDVDAWVKDVAKLNISIERLRARITQLQQRQQGDKA